MVIQNSKNMKNKLYFFASLSAFALAFWSCDSDKDIVVPKTTVIENNGKPFVATTESYSPETKTSLNNSNVLWKTGDQVSVFAASTTNDRYQVTDDSNGKSSASLNKINPAGFVAGVDIDDNVAYYPYSASNAVEKNGSDYDLTVSLPSTQNYAENSFGNGAFPMAAVTDGSGDMKLTFKNVLGGLKLQLTGTDIISRIEVSGNNDEILCGDATVTASKTTTPSIVLSDDTKTVVTLDCGSGVQLDSETPTTFIIALPPMIMTGGFTIDIFNTENGTQQIKSTKSQTITRSALLAMPTIAVSLESPSPYVAVDLGLSAKWATFNVGATAPEEYGDYYAWGETEPYYEAGYAQEDPQAHWKDGKSSGYDWCTYKYCNDSHHALTKYCNDSSYGNDGFTDTKIMLDPEDDVAHVTWGGDWRMPTHSELAELINSDNCTWTWTTQNGVNGYLVTSNKPGFEGASIFLPAAGCRNDDGLDTGLERLGSYGGYWSSSLDTDYASVAWGLVFGSVSHDPCDHFRHCGISVRPVCPSEKWLNDYSISLDCDTAIIRPGYTYTISATQKNGEDVISYSGITWSSSDTDVATINENGVVTAIAEGIVIITASNCGKTASCIVIVKYPDPEYVDLGLSVKWATFNVGATAPEEYGDYFAWGETAPYYEVGYAQESPQAHWKDGKTCGYAWPSYKYCNGSDATMTKYCNDSSYGNNGFTDTKTTLDPEDDVAHVAWGGSWRMPTKDEFTELLINCTWTWTTQNGINGHQVTSKKSGYEGASIFLPAAGLRDDTNLYNIGQVGYYGSSSLDTGGPSFAWHFEFTSGTRGTYGFYRCMGPSVRPVCP